MGLSTTQHPSNSTTSTPSIRQLSWNNESKLMSGVLPNARRTTDYKRKSEILPVQQYIIRNNSTFWDRGENTIYEIPTIPQYTFNIQQARDKNVQLFTTEQQMMNVCKEIYHTKIIRDGSIIGYDIIESYGEKRSLLKIHDHGDTNSSLQRTFKAFFKSPVKKWDIENRQLFIDLPNHTQLGIIHDVYPDHRVFFPSIEYSIPRLEMQTMASLGTQYALAVTDIAEPIGWCFTSVIGRFTPRSETYHLVLFHCTKEEAVLWLTTVIATDMKRRKVQNTQYGRAPLIGPALF